MLAGDSIEELIDTLIGFVAKRGDRPKEIVVGDNVHRLLRSEMQRASGVSAPRPLTSFGDYPLRVVDAPWAIEVIPVPPPELCPSCNGSGVRVDAR